LPKESVLEKVAADNPTADERSPKPQISPTRARHEHVSTVDVEPVHFSAAQRDQLACSSPKSKGIESGKHIKSMLG
jgi:hypothetical protein